MTTQQFSIHHLADATYVIPTLSEWLFAQWSYLHSHDSIERRRAILHSHLNKKTIPFTFVAVRNRKPLGSASVVQHDIPNRQDLTPCVASVYVHAPYRRQGVASALMNAVSEHAFQLGHSALYLFTWDQEKLYASLGWETIDRTVYHNEPIVIMRKER